MSNLKPYKYYLLGPLTLLQTVSAILEIHYATAEKQSNWQIYEIDGRAQINRPSLTSLCQFLFVENFLPTFFFP